MCDTKTYQEVRREGWNLFGLCLLLPSPTPSPSCLFPPCVPGSLPALPPGRLLLRAPRPLLFLFCRLEYPVSCLQPSALAPLPQAQADHCLLHEVPLVTSPPQAPAFCVSPAGPFFGHVLSFQLETTALVTEATSPKCSFPHRARETLAEGSDRCTEPGSRLFVLLPAKRPPTWTLPARREPNTIVGWSCRGDIRKPRQPYEISSWLLLCDSRAKNKIPGDPGRCHCCCY